MKTSESITITKNTITARATSLGFSVVERDGELLVYATTGVLVARYSAPGRSFLMLLDAERVEIPHGATIIAAESGN